MTDEEEPESEDTATTSVTAAFASLAINVQINTTNNTTSGPNSGITSAGSSSSGLNSGITAVEDPTSRSIPAPPHPASAVPGRSRPNTGALEALGPDVRFYAVWRTGPTTEFAGVHFGPFPQVWQGVLQLLPNRTYTPRNAALRRQPTLEAAEALYLSEASRHGSRAVILYWVYP